MVVVLLSSGGAEAARKPKKDKAAVEVKKVAPALPAEKLAKVRELLFGEDDGTAVDAAKALGSSGASNAFEPLVDLLSVGAVPARTQAAIEALGGLADPRTIDVLEVYAGNRSADVRRRAVKSLAAIKDDKGEHVVTALLTALGDAAPDVRAVAADALAARKEAKAGPRLLALVKRNDAGAAPALGLLATPELVPQLAELQGAVDDNVVAAALGEYIKRDDVPDPLRVDVVHTIGRLSGAASTAALVEYLAALPAKDDRPSKKEAQKLVDEKGTAK